MSRRALLSPEQRIRLFGIPVDQAEMARHYVLSAEDLALVRAKRRVSNRLGFAVATLRSPISRPRARSRGSAAGVVALICCKPDRH
jgi:hypothetical protein